MTRRSPSGRERKRIVLAARFVVSLCLVVAVLLPAARPMGISARETASIPGEVDPFADVVPGAEAPAKRAANDLSAVTMDVVLDPDSGTINGEMVVAWRNSTSLPLAEVWFRLFPNAEYYAEGELDVGDVTVDDAAVLPDLALDDTALRVPLPRSVAPGESVEIALAFTATIPVDSTGSYGIFTQDTRNGTWVLADWHPILAVYEEESGWALPPVTDFGDPTYAPSAFYDVSVAAPADLEVVATGVVAEEVEGDGLVTRRYVAGPSRDFVIVADDDHAAISRDVGNTRLTLWTAPDLDPAIGERTLDIAADALRFYNDRFGPYPASQIDLVQTDASGALGIAWAGLLFLDGPSLLETYGERNPDGLAAVIAHEVSHLWWGILIGGDSNEHGFMQEGLATVSSILYLEEALGPEAAAQELDAWVIRPARKLLNAGDAVVDTPSSDSQSEAIRSAAMYGKGSLGFLAIREEIGPEAFTAALRDVATRYTWGEITPDDLRPAFETASGRDLSTFWRHWFDEAAMTQEEIDALAVAWSSP